MSSAAARLHRVASNLVRKLSESGFSELNNLQN